MRKHLWMSRPSSLLATCLFAGLLATTLAPVETRAQAESAAEEDVVAPETQSEPQPAQTPAPALEESREAGDAPENAIAHEGPTPVPNSRGLEESGLSNPTGNGEFKRPLLFAPEDNGLQPESPQIKWEFATTGSRITMGGLKLDAASITLRLDQVARKSADPALVIVENGPGALTSLSFSWPTILTKSGTLTIEGLDGKVKWSQNITPEMLSAWRVKQVNFKTGALRSHDATTWGTTDLPIKVVRALRATPLVRACLSSKKSELERVRICSEPHKVALRAGRTRIESAPVATRSGVYVGDKDVGPRGLINAPIGREVALKIAFANGSTIELSSQPVVLDLLDVVESKDGREIILTGRGTPPLGKKKVISRPEKHFWSATGVAQDTIWQVALPTDGPTIRVLGTYNLPYTYLFRYERLPRESDRVFVRERATTGSYSSSPLIIGYGQQKGPISSQESSAKRVEDGRFEWTFLAPERGVQNRARLIVPAGEGGTTKWIAHHSLYRGYPIEASARLTGVVTTDGQTVVLGELASSAWFESLGFTQNDLISRQRWGIAARYFRALTQIQSSTGAVIDDFTALNLDLKYNLVRGIWNRDELFGLVGSTQKISIGGLNANMGGIGFYWARTMPRVFADFFEVLPYLDYSKYVDVELIYYPLIVAGNATAGTSYNLNFHGKVFWTKRFYGEAGFGLKQFEFSDNDVGRSINFSTAYGTVGVGVIF